MALELLFLGSGTSSGVPMIACDCAVCMSSDPKDKRTRASVLVSYPHEGQRRQYLIDTSPEIRIQMVRHGIKRLDGVLYTHAHADHILGIDDLRRFNAAMQAPIDVFAEAMVVERLKKMFGYIFEPHKNVNQSFVAELIMRPIEAGKEIELNGAKWTPVRLMHGRLPVAGFRVEWGGRALAYCTDVSSVPPESYPLLEGLDVLVIDALRYRHHPLHLTFDQALEVIGAVKPGRAYLTHMSHDASHAELEAKMPAGVFPSYDGLLVKVGDE